MDLRLPVDFERLPEFRMLTQGLAEFRNNQKEAPDIARALQKEVESASTFIWMRLWVELSYLAQTTNRPGLLTKSGAELYEQSLEPLFGDNCRPVALLKSAGALVDSEAGGFYCDRFAKMNEHLAGNYKSRELRGAMGSALARNQERIQKDADTQAMLLPPEVFRRGDGTKLEAVEIKRAMVCIKTLDNCLKISGRKNGEYTEGLIADADAACSKHGPELYSFYVWLSTNRDSPVLPKTTEQILAEFERVLVMSKS